jgi:hypothetical protein
MATSDHDRQPRRRSTDDAGEPPRPAGGAAAPGTARPILVVGGTTAAAVAVLAGSWRAFGPTSRRFAFVAVWAPMTWLGTISRVVTPSLPARFHELRPFEHDGARFYELLGVRVIKTLVRQRPLAVFNPDLHLPHEPTPERIAHLDRRMRDAEASHGLLFVATLATAAAARACGWRSTARWMLAWDIVLNGYPVMLQRYNRGRLAGRFGAVESLPG